jgi:hypothetical protein
VVMDSHNDHLGNAPYSLSDLSSFGIRSTFATPAYNRRLIIRTRLTNKKTKQGMSKAHSDKQMILTPRGKVNIPQITNSLFYKSAKPSLYETAVETPLFFQAIHFNTHDMSSVGESPFSKRYSHSGNEANTQQPTRTPYPSFFHDAVNFEKFTLSDAITPKMKYFKQ